MTENADVRFGLLLARSQVSRENFEESLAELDWLTEDERWRQVDGGRFSSLDDLVIETDLSQFTNVIERRRSLFKKLSDAGASTKAIAASSDLTERTVQRDIKAETERHDVAADGQPISPDQDHQGEPLDGERHDVAVTSSDQGQSTGDTSDNGDPDDEPPPPRPQPTITLYTHEGTPVEYPEPKGKSSFNATPGEGISWASWSWNPVTGCLHGCKYCYARELATSERLARSYPAGFTPLFHPERLNAPANTSIPAKHADDSAWRRVFVCSMADLYGRWVPDEWIDKVHASMLSSLQWEYILLTKFPSRYNKVDLPPSAWVGTSVDDQRRVPIAEDAFRKIDGVKVKWLSLEPLLAPLEFTDLSMFDWVVIGAQTETRQPDGPVPAFQPPWQWVLRVTQQAIDAGCKVHWKPNLHHGPGMTWPDEYPVA